MRILLNLKLQHFTIKLTVSQREKLFFLSLWDWHVGLGLLPVELPRAWYFYLCYEVEGFQPSLVVLARLCMLHCSLGTLSLWHRVINHMMVIHASLADKICFA